MSEIAARVLWLLHFPYPDGTWRGLEKSYTVDGMQPLPPAAESMVSPSTPLLFEEEEEARRFAERFGVVGAVPVQVSLLTPFVGRSLDAVGAAGEDRAGRVDGSCHVCHGSGSAGIMAVDTVGPERDIPCSECDGTGLDALGQALKSLRGSEQTVRALRAERDEWKRKFERLHSAYEHGCPDCDYERICREVVVSALVEIGGLLGVEYDVDGHPEHGQYVDAVRGLTVERDALRAEAACAARMRPIVQALATEVSTSNPTILGVMRRLGHTEHLRTKGVGWLIQAAGDPK